MKLHITLRRVVYSGLAIGLVFFVGLTLLKPDREVVDLAKVQSRALEVTVEEDGRTRSADSYLVVAPVAGRLQRLTVREGQRVNRNDIIARIEPLPQDLAGRAQALAEFEVSVAREQAARTALQQAQLEQAHADRQWDRRSELAAVGGLPAEQMEQFALARRIAEQATASAQEVLRAASAETRAARSRLRSTNAPNTVVVPVRASASGAITRVPDRSARMVGTGEVLVEVGDMTSLEIVVDVLSVDAIRIAAGQRAMISNWGGPPIEATVLRVEPAGFTKLSALGVEEQRVNVVLLFDSCPPTLGPGFRVDASIVVWSTPRTLTAPTAAFFRQGSQWITFVRKGDRVYIRPVLLGQRSAQEVQILDGLTDGEEIVIFPSDRLANGTRVVRR